ncbi:MAG: oligosaccharide flippase family protein [Elusimicrobia bacterium]|nr:oligosaccharide flippase family protein [Elusimicrobiota bacterium]
MKNTVIGNTLLNILGKIFNYILQLVLITYLIKTLGVEEYGVFVLAVALIGNSNLLEAGFGLSSTKYIAEYNAKKDIESINKVIATNFIINTFMALFFAFILLLINEFYLGTIFKISPVLLYKAKISIRILIVLSFIEFWVVGFIRVMEGFQNYFYARLMENIKWFFRFILIFILFKFEKGLIPVCWAYLFAGIIELFTIWYISLKLHKEIDMDFRKFDFNILKINFNFSIWIIISKLSSLIMYRLNTIVLGIFVETSYISYYNVASKIYELLKYGISLLSSAIIPVASELKAKNEDDKLRKLFLKSTYYTVVICSPFILFLSFNSSAVIKIWMGEGFEPSFIIASILSFSLLPVLFSSSGAEIFAGIGKIKDLVVYSLVSSIVGFLLMIYMINHYKLLAVAWGSFLASFLVSFGYLKCFLKYFGISFFVFLKELIKPLFLIFFLSLIIFLNRGISFFFFMIPCYFIFSYFVIFHNEDKSLIKSRL